MASAVNAVSRRRRGPKARVDRGCNPAILGHHGRRPAVTVRFSPPTLRGNAPPVTDQKDEMILRAYHAATAQNPDFNPRESDIGDLIPAMQKLLPGVTAEEIRWWRDATDFWQELSSIGNAIQGEGADVVRRQLLGLNGYMADGSTIIRMSLAKSIRWKTGP